MLRGIGQAIAVLRAKSGNIKQAELADKAGVTRSMLSAYESEKVSPSLENLAKLLVAMGRDFIDLGVELREVQGLGPKTGQGGDRALLAMLVREMISKKVISLDEIEALA